MTTINWPEYGNSIADNELSAINNRVRDIDAIIQELKEIHQNYNTHAMSDHGLWLKGGKEMLGEVIEYLERL